MIAGYHLIWTAYASWLPNDPRGSSSQEIRSDYLLELGELHHGRKKIQPCSAIIREFYNEARPLLKHKVYTFNDEEIVILGEVFGEVMTQRKYTCYGCAIMHDHVHMLIRKHRDQAEEMIAAMQESSARRFLDLQLRPVGHPVWGGPGWKVYLDSRDAMERVVQYIRNNPLKAGWPAQVWDFVHEYDGWLPGIGARRLK